MKEDMKLSVALAILRSKGAVEVVICYSGGGDSGGIDSTVAYDAARAPVAMPDKLNLKITDWAEANAMPQDGWWNNDGGGGTIIIDLETLKVTVEHYDYEQVQNNRDPVEMFLADEPEDAK